MWLRKKSVLWTWCCSYIVVLLIPLITILINYHMNIDTMKQELIRTNQLTFDNAADNINRYLELLRENYVYAFLNDSFEELQNREEKDYSFYNNTKELTDHLLSYRNGVDEMFCMIYLKNKDYLVTSWNSCEADYYYRGMMYTYKDFVDYEEWQEILNADYTEDYLIGRGMNYWTNQENLIYANTVKGAGKEKYNILVSIPLSLVENVTEYLNEDSWLLLHIGELPPLVFHDGRLTEASEWIEDKNYAIRLSKDSVVSKISYELVFSQQSILEELSGVRATFWRSIIITLSLAGIGIAILVYLNYRPVYSIMNEIGEIENRAEKNEFATLKDSYLQLRQEKYSSQMQVEKQRKELLNAWLLMLMKGRAAGLKAQEAEEYWGVNLKNKIALVGFMLPLDRPAAGADVEYEDLQFFILDNIFSELMGEQQFYHVEDGCFVFYLFDLKPDREEQWRMEVLEKAEYVSTLLYDKWKISVVGVVSDVGEGIDVIKFLYQNVMDTFEYGKVTGGQSIIDARTAPNYDAFDMLEDYVKKEFRAAFSERDAERACAVLDVIFVPHSITASSIALAKVHAYNMFVIAMDIFQEYVTDIMQRESAFRYLEFLLKAENTEELKESFGNLLQFQIKIISRKQAQESKGIVVNVMQYVEANYTDYNLNLSSIAEALGKNSRYISRVFKDETQTGILDYINSIRIKKAKEIMRDRKCTVEEVAARVGYNNSRSFRRAFVKITGEMPSEYVE